MIVLGANPWGAAGGSLEAQRTDLWRLDMSAAVAYFSSQSEELFTSLGLNKLEMPSASDAAYEAIRVLLPVQKVSTQRVIEGTVPRNMPGYNEPSDTARVDFIHDTLADRSAIYTLLQIWRSAVRIGRQGLISEESQMLPSATFRPVFRFDITVQLLNGATRENADEEAGEGPEDLSGVGFFEGAKYTLFGCWPKVIQQNVIDKSRQAQAHIISVQFQVEEVQ